MNLSLSHVRTMFATYVAVKSAKGKSTEGSLSETIAVKYGLSKGMKSAVS